MQRDRIASYLMNKGFRPDMKGFYCLVSLLERSITEARHIPVCQMYRAEAERIGATYYCVEADLRRLIAAYNAIHADRSYLSTGEAIARLTIELRSTL